MADLPYDATNGQNIQDGVKDLNPMDDNYDPVSPSPYLYEARDAANVRDWIQYVRDLIGDARTIWGKVIDETTASSPSNAYLLQYNTAAGKWLAQAFAPDTIQFNTALSAPSHSEGLVYYDQTNKCLAYMNDEADVVMQIGQESWVRVYNDTVSTITNGQVCYLSGVFSTFPTVGLADASDASKCLSTLGFATHSIEPSSYGYITTSGIVRDLNTAGCSTGALIYLSGTTPGGYTDTIPDSPNYNIVLGNCGVVDASVGTISTRVAVGTNTGDVIKIFNGSILEDHSTTVTSNGTVITLSLEKSGGGDLSLFYDGGFDEFDSTPAATVSLTAGTDTAPVLNYVYIPKDTMTLTASTTGFDSSQQVVPVATVLCQSAASLQTDGPLKHHAWTDHLSDSIGQGHLSHVNKWIRSQNATWISGAQLTGTAGVNQFDVSTTAGSMLQLHEHPLDVFNTATGSDIYIVNEFTTKYKKVGDLTQEITDSAGGSLSGRYYKIVFWIAGNEGSGQDKLYCNFPSGSYNSASGALTDLSSYADFSIPSSFKGTGVLIAALTMRNQSGAGGTFTVETNTDLRGLVPSSAAGGGASGGGGAENFVDLLDVPSSYSGEGLKAVRVNTGETALEFYAPTVVTNTTQTFSASMTPVWSTGFDVENMTVGTVTSAATFNNASVAPAEGMQINIAFQQNATGGYQITLGSNYKLADNNTAHPTGANEEFYFSGIVRSDGTIYGGWTPVDVPETLTTKGDLLVFDTDTTRLPVGTNDQVLTADSTQASGVKWATPASGSGGTVQGTDQTYDIRATDEGTTAGNTRGENSIDLSTVRAAATQVASGTLSTIIGGSTNTASGLGSVVTGGYNNIASGQYSVASGQNANADHYGEVAYSTSSFSQYGSVSGRRSTSDTTQVDLYLDGSSAQLTLNDDEVYSCVIHIAGAQADGSSGRWRREVNITRQGTTTSLDGSVSTVGTDHESTNIGSPTITIEADDTNDALAIKVTPANSTATRWAVRVDYVKVFF